MFYLKHFSVADNLDTQQFVVHISMIRDKNNICKKFQGSDICRFYIYTSPYNTCRCGSKSMTGPNLQIPVLLCIASFNVGGMIYA